MTFRAAFTYLSSACSLFINVGGEHSSSSPGFVILLLYAYTRRRKTLKFHSWFPSARLLMLSKDHRESILSSVCSFSQSRNEFLISFCHLERRCAENLSLYLIEYETNMLLIEIISIMMTIILDYDAIMSSRGSHLLQRSPTYPSWQISGGKSEHSFMKTMTWRKINFFTCFRRLMSRWEWRRISYASKKIIKLK